jgi:ATP-binding cassette subfamily C protein CydCD
VAVGFGVLSGVAGVVLTGAAAWLLVRAATMPPVLTLSTAVVIVRGSAVIRPLARYLERLNAHGVAFARLGRWRAEVFADLVPRVPGVGLHRRGELLGRIVEDVDARVDGLLRGRLPAAASAVTLAAAGLVAMAMLPSAAVALGAGLVIAAGVAPTLAGRQALRREEATVKARAELADAVVETVEGLDELAGRGVSTALRVPVDRGRALARIEAHAARSAGTALALAHLGLGLAVVGTALALAAAVDSDRVGAEVAAVLLLGVVALAEPVLGLPDAAIARRRATAAQTRLTAVRSIPRSIQSPSRIIDPDGHPGDSIVVRGLVAGWDPARPPGLTGLDLELPAGSRIAIVGPSGGGKSTLAAVLAGLLDPIAGTVGQAGQRLALAGVRVALVGDEVDHVFASTLRENLRPARPTADDQALIDVLNRVRLGDWLTGLPAGLDTWLGEGGSTMSGGERRRLVTARALLTEPDLLVLDEPTEGLDEPTARALMADLLAVTVGRRVLLLTHRQEGLDQVDSVHELSDGRLRSLMNA